MEELQRYGDNTRWLVEGLKTDPKRGIETSDAEILLRKDKYGTN